MTDYTKTSGTTGKMMIRDLGSVVEFWFQAGYSSDYWNPLQFNITANGSTSATININYTTGRPWVKVGSRTVNSTQTVTFRLLTATGTSGMGGPTTFSVYLKRSSVPAAPTSVKLSDIGFTSIMASFSDNSNGGLAITARQIGYNDINSTTTNLKTVYSDGSTLITGLKPATKYYFWARVYNANGWSAWSYGTSGSTFAGVRLKVGLVWKLAVPYVRVGGVWKIAMPWARRAGAWRQGV